MSNRFRLIGAVAIVAALVPTLACEEQAPTTPGAVGLPFTESFVGTLQPGGEAFYAFSMSKSGIVSLTLISVTGTSVPADALFPLGIGQPFGSSCSASVDVAATPGASPQFSANKVQGVYCVKISDTAGRLGASANFVLNITHPR
jgi:hypothetical protein